MGHRVSVTEVVVWNRIGHVLRFSGPPTVNSITRRVSYVFLFSRQCVEPDDRRQPAGPRTQQPVPRLRDARADDLIHMGHRL